MSHKAPENTHLPTIFIVRDGERQIESNSSILSAFNIVYFSESQHSEVLTWIQQNQPDLIVLEYEHFSEHFLSSIASLKLDWLTRNIPIVVAGNRFTLKPIENLDYDACLHLPYSAADLERIICSLIRLPICDVAAG